MDDMRVTVPVSARLTWNYEVTSPRLAALYEQGKQGQWNAATDIDWSVEVDCGKPLPDNASLSSFLASPLGPYGRTLWNSFQWEFQWWMVSQSIHGEQGALVATARLAEEMPGIEAKLYAANQVGDEARHVEAFSRYAREKMPQAQYEVTPPLFSLLRDILGDSRWDMVALGMQIMIEALGMAIFRAASTSFHDSLIREITRRVARDEARHVAFGVIALSEAYRDITGSELREREEFVLDAASLLRRRFLFEDLWERMEVPLSDGVEFAQSSPEMIAYRRTVFAKVISALVQIGLMTPRVEEGFGKLDLLGYTGRRTLSRRRLPAAHPVR
jgi:hypothetical protein